MNLLLSVYGEFLALIIRAITGRLYTEEQIKSVTSSAIGRYFSGFFPTPKEELAAEERVNSARLHTEAAAAIIRDMQEDLEAQDRKLGELLTQIEQKKELADRYQALAETNQEAFRAFRAEMEEALRHELIGQAQRGRRLRQFVSLTVWLITLTVGAALGAYFKQLVQWVTQAT